MKNPILRTTGLLSCAVILVLLSSCAHHRDVRASADGVHRVVVRAPDQETAERSAIDQANHFCEERKLTAAFVNEETKYTGEMDESTRKTVNKASKAAMILGGTGAAVGRGGVRTTGGAVGTAGVIGSVMTGGDDYQADMRFKCQ